MRKRINVTQRDIDKGVCSDPGLCAVALAASRAFHEPVRAGTGVLITGQTADYTGGTIIAWLPEEVSDWIVKFDIGLRVDPIAFHVNTVNFDLKAVEDAANAS